MKMDDAALFLRTLSDWVMDVYDDLYEKGLDMMDLLDISEWLDDVAEEVEVRLEERK